MIKTIEGTEIKCNLQELAVPSLNMGAMTSGDLQLNSKPTGSLGEFNHIGKDEYQAAYEKPVSQNPVGIAPNNPTTGEFHLNGELWKSNENDIDSGDVSQMADMLRQGGVEHINQDLLDQLRSGYEWEFNNLTKKDKFAAMTITVDHLLQYPRYYDQLRNVIDGDEVDELDEMWVGTFDGDVKVHKGWPVGRHSKLSADKEKKEKESLDEEINRIVHHIKAMSEMVHAGNGERIIPNSFVAALDEDFAPVLPRPIKPTKYGKYALLEAINTIIEQEENAYWNKQLANSPVVPLSKDKFRQFRRDLITQIKSGARNERIKEVIKEGDIPIAGFWELDPINVVPQDQKPSKKYNLGDLDKNQMVAIAPKKHKSDPPVIVPATQIKTGVNEGEPKQPENESEIDEISASDGAGPYNSARWVSKDPRGNVRSAETLGMRLAPAKKENKQDPHYWARNHRVDPRNKFGKTRDVLGTDGRKVDSLPETLETIKSVLGGLTNEQKLEALKRVLFILEVRQAVAELKKGRPMRENSFDPAPAGMGAISYQAPLGTQNSAFQSPDHFGSAQSPNTETTSSFNGAGDRQEQPELGTEPAGWSGNSYNESAYPKRKDGSLDERHDGRRINLGKIVQGTGFSRHD